MRPRRAARVLLLDARDRLLLLHGRDPARPDFDYWFTVGGGLDPEETPAQGAARELAEETGLSMPVGALGQPVWSQLTRFSYGGQWLEQEQDFFVLRVPSWEVAMDGHDEIEQATIDGFRWWSLAELDATTDRYYPAELPELLRGILEQ